MASLRFVCVLLLLSASSSAQKADVAAQNNSATTVRNEEAQAAAKNPEQPAPETTRNPATSAVKPVTEAPGNGTTTAPSEVVDPQIAAKQLKGSSEFDKTPFVADPDAVKINLGAKCSANSDCSMINNTQCKDGMCLCTTGFIPSKHGMDKCIKVPSGLGDTCEEEAQCNHAVPDSECRDSKCDCPPNYIFDQGRCWEKQTLGGICNNSIQCEHITFAMCAQGVCTCDPPLIPSPMNKCLQPAGELYHASCVEDIQCTYSYGDEAHCSNGQCRCTNNYHYNGTTCIVDIQLGESCLTHEDCAVSEINNVEDSRMCENGSCTCATGFNILPGENICTKSSGEELAVSLTWVLCIVLAKYYLS